MGWIDSVKDNMFAPVELSDWKKEYVDFLIENGVFKIGGHSKLKSGRDSPTFLDYSRINLGLQTYQIGHYFAQGIQEHFPEETAPFKTIIGPSYKGNSLSHAASIALALENKRNVGWTNDRKEEKAYGEGTDATKEAAGKRLFVGFIPKDNDAVLLQDDVLTTGLTKDDEVKKLNSVANVKYTGLILGGNREEVDIDGNNAVEEFGKRHNMPVHSLINVLSEAVPYLSMQGKIDESTQRRLVGYTRAYGTEEIKKWCRDIKFIERDKGIIPACDVPLEVFGNILEATHDIPEVVAYKISGLRSGRKGWETWVEKARKHTDKPLILDYQKAGNDIPDLADDFMTDVKETGFNAIIIFPFAGGLTHSEWIRAAFENDLEVIAGGEMTPPNFKLSEGGYLADQMLTPMYIRSAKYGVNNFVVPANKPESSKAHVEAIRKAVPGIKVSAYSPGLVAQGGDVSAITESFDRWYGIIGRGIIGDIKTEKRYKTVDEMREATFQHVSKLK
jgi:orotate phosphoribosyltransferase